MSAITVEGDSVQSEEALAALAACLRQVGCPADKCDAMADQLARRARQLAEQKNRSYEEALLHLLNLMRQGWAARAAAGSPADEGQP